jgi:hypothetical protein
VDGSGRGRNSYTFLFPFLVLPQPIPVPTATERPTQSISNTEQGNSAIAPTRGWVSASAVIGRHNSRYLASLEVYLSEYEEQQQQFKKSPRYNKSIESNYVTSTERRSKQWIINTFKCSQRNVTYEFVSSPII